MTCGAAAWGGAAAGGEAAGEAPAGPQGFENFGALPRDDLGLGSRGRSLGASGMCDECYWNAIDSNASRCQATAGHVWQARYTDDLAKLLPFVARLRQMGQPVRMCSAPSA